MKGEEGTSARYYPSFFPAILSSRETMSGLSDREVRVRLVHSGNDFFLKNPFASEKWSGSPLFFWQVFHTEQQTLHSTIYNRADGQIVKPK